MDDTFPMDGEGSDTMTSPADEPRTVTVDTETGEVISESRPPTESNVVALDPDAPLPTRCTAHNRRGSQCGRAPVPGASVCHYHGGAAPQVREKAAERLTAARDMALERLIEFIADDGDIADPRILLDSVTKLTTQVELLQGRATSRTEVDERVHYEQVRIDLIAKLDDLAARHRVGIQRPQDEQVVDIEPSPQEALPEGPHIEAPTEAPI